MISILKALSDILIVRHSFILESNPSLQRFYLHFVKDHYTLYLNKNHDKLTLL